MAKQHVYYGTSRGACGCEIEDDEFARYLDLVFETLRKVFPKAAIEVEEIDLGTRAACVGDFSGLGWRVEPDESDVRHFAREVWYEGEFWSDCEDTNEVTP